MRIEITREQLRADLELIKQAAVDPSKEIRLAVTVVHAGANESAKASAVVEDVESKTAVFNAPKEEKRRAQMQAPSMPKLK